MLDKDNVDCDPMRLRLSLFGDGDTGSPRRRLRALEMALVGAGGDVFGDNAGVDGFAL
jgi:hypothetical protein